MFDPPDNIFKKQASDEAIKTLQYVYPRHYSGDNMFVANRNMHFADDERFQTCLQNLAKGEPYKSMAWRMHGLIWATEMALRHGGDFMEFGTFRGFKMKFLMEYFGLRLNDRPVFLFDTFDGIDPTQCDGSPIEPAEHQKTGLYDFVKNRFKEHRNVKVIKGAAPQSIDKIDLKPIAFLHLDMNSWQAEIGVLDRLWNYIVPGGVIVLDDFGLYSHKAQMEHELPWPRNKDCTPLELPTGQALVIKHV